MLITNAKLVLLIDMTPGTSTNHSPHHLRASGFNPNYRTHTDTE